MTPFFNKFPLRYVVIGGKQVLITNLIKFFGDSYIGVPEGLINETEIQPSETLYSVSQRLFKTPDLWYILFLMNGFSDFKGGRHNISEISTDDTEILYYVKEDGTATTLDAVRRNQPEKYLNATDYTIMHDLELSAVSNATDILIRYWRKHPKTIQYLPISAMMEIDESITKAIGGLIE